MVHAQEAVRWVWAVRQDQGHLRAERGRGLRIRERVHRLHASKGVRPGSLEGHRNGDAQRDQGRLPGGGREDDHRRRRDSPRGLLHDRLRGLRPQQLEGGGRPVQPRHHGADHVGGGHHPRGVHGQHHRRPQQQARHGGGYRRPRQCEGGHRQRPAVRHVQLHRRPALELQGPCYFQHGVLRLQEPARKPRCRADWRRQVGGSCDR
mmetsp:Transcript_58728/g.134307  ORF Transcript_58728/g.134307 Transcript_58728/m.134307 type:complete len:206 (+) Transcript_58728:423-1040(+)